MRHEWMWLHGMTAGTRPRFILQSSTFINPGKGLLLPGLVLIAQIKKNKTTPQLPIMYYM